MYINSSSGSVVILQRAVATPQSDFVDAGRRMGRQQVSYYAERPWRNASQPPVVEALQPQSTATRPIDEPFAGQRLLALSWLVAVCIATAVVYVAMLSAR